MKYLEQEQSNPYCKICESCGHDGCCSFIKCFSKLIANVDCDNGATYLKDAKFAYSIYQLSEEIMNKLENGLYDKDLAVMEYRKEWNRIYDKIYK